MGGNLRGRKARPFHGNRRFRRIPQTFPIPVLGASAFGLLIHNANWLTLRKRLGGTTDQFGIDPGTHHVSNESGDVGQSAAASNSSQARSRSSSAME